MSFDINLKNIPHKVLLTEACRACLVHGVRMYNLFELNLHEKIFFCSSVHVSEDDGLSPNLCHKCLKTVALYCEFKNKCLVSDQILKQVKDKVSRISGDSNFNSEIKISDDYDIKSYLSDENTAENEEALPIENCETAEAQLVKKADDYENLDYKSNLTFDYDDGNDNLSYCSESDSKPDIKTEEFTDTDESENYEPKKKKKQEKKKSLPANKKKRRKISHCDVCRTAFKNKEDLINHRKEHRENPHCTVCEQPFAVLSALLSHLKVHKDVTKLKCDVCELLLANRKTFLRHRKLHEHKRLRSLIQHTSRNVPNKCVVCNQQFTNFTDLTSHVTKHNMSCDICNITATNGKIFVRHMQLHDHDNPRLYSCSVCFDAYYTEEELRKHRKVHGKKRYGCKRCGSTYSELKSLAVHIESKHKSDIQDYACKYCNRKFIMKLQLQNHLKLRHASEGKTNEPIHCEVCDSTFRAKSHLTIHMKKHTGEMPKIVCDVCGKQYYRNDMPVHMRFHTGERPYKCDFCHKAFTIRAHLKSHLTIHTGEKPFVCHVCGTGYSRAGVLKSHMRIHTGEKPFVCQICQQPFRALMALKTHMKVH